MFAPEYYNHYADFTGPSFDTRYTYQENYQQDSHVEQRPRDKQLKKQAERFIKAINEALTGRKSLRSSEKDTVLTVGKILGVVKDEEDRQLIVLSKLFKYKDKKARQECMVDSIQFALLFNSLKLFYALLQKVDSRGYLNQYELLEQAIMSKDEKQLTIVLRVYKQHDVRISLASLDEKTRQALFHSSWSMDIVELLYPYANQFFIPRGQDKAKMYAFICYNLFEPGTDEHPKREGAREEAQSIKKGLQDCGFTIRGPLIDWTFEKLIQFLKEHIEEISKTCSVLFISIMTHGDKGIVFDKNGKRGRVNHILRELNGLRSITPAVVLLQACQGEKKPDQQIDIDYHMSAIDGPPVDALPNQKSSTAGTHVLDSTDNELMRAFKVLERYDCHISVTRPNTIVVTATAESYYATRTYFLKHMAKYLENADGSMTFSTMVQLVSRDMSLHPEEDCRRQAPAVYELMRQPLVLPLAAAYERKRVQRTSASGGAPSNFATGVRLFDEGRKLLKGMAKSKVKKAKEMLGLRPKSKGKASSESYDQNYDND